MSQDVITTQRPPIPFWRRRPVVTIAFVALLAAGAGAAIGALVASDASVTYRYRSAPAPTRAPRHPPPRVSATASLDGGPLLAAIVATPNGAATIAASSSPQARQLIGDAAVANAESSTYMPSADPPAMPDAATLAAALGRLDAADRQLVLTGLPPEIQTEVGASLNDVAAIPSCP